MRKKIDDWLYDNWKECVIGCVIGEILAMLTIYAF